MKLNKRILKILTIVWCITIFISTLLLSVFNRCYDIDFYDNQYQKWSLQDYSGLDSNDYHDGMNVLLQYLQDKADDINIEVTVNDNYGLLFNDREISHMVDVKNLALNCYRLMEISIVITLIITLLLFLNKNNVWTILKSSMIQIYSCIGLFIIFIAMSMISNFNYFWTQFHHIFFPDNDLWLLDPATDNMIRMLPSELFNDLVSQIIILFVLSFLFINIIISIYFRKEFKHD